MLRSNVVEVFPLLAGRVEELDTGDDVRSRTCALVDRLRRWYRPGLRCLRGLRIGELAGLTRRRVDLLRGTVEVAEIVTRWRAASVVACPRLAPAAAPWACPAGSSLSSRSTWPPTPRPVPPRPCSRRAGRPAAGHRVPRPGMAASDRRGGPGRAEGARAAPHCRGAVDRRRASPKEVASRAGRAHLRLVHSRPLRRPVRGPRPGAARPPRRQFEDAHEGQVFALDRGASGPKVV